MKEYNLDYFKKKDIYDWKEIIGIIEIMESDIKTTREELERLKEDIDSNYKRISVFEQYDIDDRYFIQKGGVK